jgi:hypothetical protein
MKHEEIQEILTTLQNKTANTSTEHSHQQFCVVLEKLLDEILTDRQIMKLISLVNKY